MSEDQKNRLFSIYQLLLSFSESEEIELFADRGVIENEAYIERAIAYAMREAAEWDEDLFENELVTRSEILDALSHGPALMAEHCQQLAATATAAQEKWAREYPECETLGEVISSMRMAGRA